MEYREVLISDVKESKFNPSIRTDRSSKKYQDIKTNIRTNGLIVPVTLGVGKKDLLLVSGHRRLNCFKDLGKLTIPATINPQINDSNYDEMFRAENIDTLSLTMAQETERYLAGAPSISVKALKTIHALEEIAGKDAITKIVKMKKSPATYLIGITMYCNYTKKKTRVAKRQALYWMFNVGTPYMLKTAINFFIPADQLIEYIENREIIEHEWTKKGMK